MSFCAPAQKSNAESGIPQKISGYATVRYEICCFHSIMEWLIFSKSLNTNVVWFGVFLIVIHSMQGWTAMTRLKKLQELQEK